MRGKNRISVTMALVLAALVLMAGFGAEPRGTGLASVQAQPRPLPVPGDRSRMFPETGKTVRGLFLDYWEKNGGLAQQGYPISGEMQEKSDLDGKLYTVQYFERAVFEYHPENKTPYDVLLTQLGTIRFKAKYPQGESDAVSLTLPASARRAPCSPTPNDEPGPYKPDPPLRNSVGKGHIVRGFVLSSASCAPIAGAKVELWPEVGGSGHDENDRAAVLTDRTGAYWYESRFPEHIHMRISAPGYKTIFSNAYHPTPGQAEGKFDIVLTPDSGCQVFQETGQAVCGVFLQYWQAHGGLPQQGYPIIGEFSEKSDLDGKTYTVQYFERAVFEMHPENQPPYDVLLSQLGTFRHREKYEKAQPTVTPSPYEGPKGRVGHELVYDDALKMVLLVNGGDVAGEAPGSPTVIWGWDGRKWQVVTTGGPEVRSLGGVAYDSRRNVLVMYGGTTEIRNFNDTWEWDGKKWEKKEVQGLGFRHHFSMVYDQERRQVVAYGGNLQPNESLQGEITFPADTWLWDGMSWRQSTASGPGSRYHYAMTYDTSHKQSLIFGGVGPGSSTLWGWDGTKWSERTASGTPPSSRLAPSMAFDEQAGNLILFGGLAGRTVLGDTWAWDGTQWSKLQVAGEQPPARSHHAAAYDRSRGRIVMFGGLTSPVEESYLADTWEWDGTIWTKVSGP